MQKSLGARSTLGKIAAQELATTEHTTVDWQSVEDRVIAESIGEHGQSRAEVIEALCEFSPGAVSQEQKDEIEKRVLAAAPALAAKYNKLTMDRSQNAMVAGRAPPAQVQHCVLAEGIPKGFDRGVFERLATGGANPPRASTALIWPGAEWVKNALPPRTIKRRSTPNRRRRSPPP